MHFLQDIQGKKSWTYQTWEKKAASLCRGAPRDLEFHSSSCHMNPSRSSCPTLRIHSEAVNSVYTITHTTEFWFWFAAKLSLWLQEIRRYLGFHRTTPVLCDFIQVNWGFCFFYRCSRKITRIHPITTASQSSWLCVSRAATHCLLKMLSSVVVYLNQAQVKF